jgi:hypothetical protein
MRARARNLRVQVCGEREGVKGPTVGRKGEEEGGEKPEGSGSRASREAGADGDPSRGPRDTNRLGAVRRIALFGTAAGAALLLMNVVLLRLLVRADRAVLRSQMVLRPARKGIAARARRRLGR